jgi:predicted HicB family RNase H-like nuclease
VRTVARIHFVIPDELHRRAKAAAAMRGETLKDYITEALEDAVDSDEKRKRKR